MSRKRKVWAGVLIVSTMLTMMPLSSCAIGNIPAKTRITKINLTENKVQLRWKKIKKCSGYKVYRKINNGRRKCIKTIKKKSKHRYTDNLPDFISGTVKYQIAAYKKAKVNGKSRIYKKFSNPKRLSIEQMTKPIDPDRTEISDDIYKEYSSVDIDALSLDTVRALILYKINDIREHEGLNSVKLDSCLNKAAQKRVEEYSRTGLVENNTEYINRFNTEFGELTYGNEKYVRITSTNERRLEITGDEEVNVKDLIYTWLQDDKWPNIRMQDQFGWESAMLVGIGYDGNYCSVGFAEETDYNRWE